MINGYITFEELLCVTGIPASVLRAILSNGVTQKQLKTYGGYREKRFYDYRQVMEWILLNIE